MQFKPTMKTTEHLKWRFGKAQFMGKSLPAAPTPALRQGAKSKALLKIKSLCWGLETKFSFEIFINHLSSC